MSHNAIIDLEINDLGTLKAAAERMGGEFIPNKKTYKWYGKFMNDYPLPEGISVNDLGKCEHAIRFPGINYEVGVVKSRLNKNNYELIYDFWDTNLRKKMGWDNGVNEGGLFKQAYGIERAKKEAFQKGKMVKEFKLKLENKERNPKIQLVINL